ncbi:hypothetical protein Ddye_010676 [Dipteronia dyeriana]|uniref:Leucine-rich repeat-containing N-terminal plant-type domain-containing protein n=1 Tax=Dipteronia dyeriana TaxID=168575 RepID=A0AAE0CNJ3_9ROSI|nr:hypothetical protein Ddye_010676 [Dipteronia dyeriana]
MAKKVNLEILLLPVFIVLLISSKPYMASASIEEANALLNWKASFADETQSRLPSWNLLSHKPSSTSPCTWFGIFCNSAGNVVKINITGFGLNGNLNKLTHLYLYNNSLSSSIPLELGNLTNLLELDIDTNRLSGSIPTTLGNMNKLTVLFAFQNNLSGPIPHEIGNLKSLIYLSFSSNNLSGLIPQSFCGLRNLTRLHLYENQLSGIIPKDANLYVLDLQKNTFHGTVPGSFAKGNQLQTLNFNGNGFEGPVPPSLGHCRMLQVLDLGNNKVTDTFPYWLGTLPKLKVFVLRSNKFYGFLRDFEGSNSFTKLQIVDLSNNNFSGFLPAGYFASLNAMKNVGGDESEWEYMGDCFYQDSEFKYMGESFYQDSISLTIKGHEIEMVKILKIFTAMDFSNNNFNGEIPEVIGKLQSLHLLNLSQNSLTGHIPSSLGNLSALESLDLSSNRLVGEIPRQLTSLNFLEVLVLSRNQLSGPIPRGSQLDTFGSDSYTDNLGLCGFPLSSDCQEDETPQPSLVSLEDDTESEYRFGWKVVLMGYGCGMVLGMIIEYLVFSIGKPLWLVRIVGKENRRKVRRPNNRRGEEESVSVNNSPPL